ncbi:hypothetical protein pb186bvf_002179 [Paramecium bursaria]
MCEQELPYNLDDFPNFHLKANIDIDKLTPDEDTRRQVTSRYLKQLEKIIRQKISSQQQRQQASDQVFELYDLYFNKTYCNTLFKDCPYPTADQVEEFSNEDFDSTVKLLYNENCFRHSFQKLFNPFNHAIALESWGNYQLLFQYIQNKQNQEIPLPPQWIYDIFDEFTYQFYASSRWRKSIKTEEVPKASEFWNLEKIEELLLSFYQNRKESPQNTIQLIANYAYLAQIKLYVMNADFNSALKLIEQISNTELLIYQKSGSAYLTLFQLAGFCYLMTQQYKKAQLTFELICQFFSKYKQLYSKSYQYDYLIKLNERLLILLAISLQFYPDRSDQNTQLLRASRYYDKFERLERYDAQTLGELFLASCPKIVSPIKSFEEYNSNQEFQVNDLLNQQRDKLVAELSVLKQVNNVEQILKLYNKISKEHFKKFIDYKYVELYQARNNSELKQVPFEQKVLGKYWQGSKLLDFDVRGDEIFVKENPVNKREFINQLQIINKQTEKTLQELLSSIN